MQQQKTNTIVVQLRWWSESTGNKKQRKVKIDSKVFAQTTEKKKPFPERGELWQEQVYRKWKQVSIFGQFNFEVMEITNSKKLHTEIWSSVEIRGQL